jgi:LuxR family maltose regulon positive regulatory protein
VTGSNVGGGSPVLPTRAFSRTRLVEVIDRGTRGRATMLVAPAGYGKSIAVTQWRLTTDRPVAWIDLGDADDDAVSFVRSLAAGFRGALPDELAPDLDLIDVRGRSLGRELIDHLVADLALVTDIVIVFDNFEAIRNSELIADVATLVTRAPTTAHFVIISRSDPGIGVGRLRVAGELTELRANDLSMTPHETSTLFERTAGLTLEDDALEQVLKRTSGWPAALQLAALTMRDVADPAGFVERFSGDDRHVADYLTEEVLDTCTDDDRRFLIETSILERASGTLCDFVTGGSGSETILHRLERSGMLLTRLDESGRWYRYHPLLRDLLRTELEVGDPHRHRELLMRAAQWHESIGDITEMGNYLVGARAWDELLEMTRLHGRGCFERGLTTTLRSQIEAIPESVRLGSTHAQLTSATLHLLTGQSQLADEELTRLEHAHHITSWEQMIIDAERSAMVAWHAPPARALSAGRRALEHIEVMPENEPPVDVLGMTSLPSLEVVALVAMGRAAHYLARDDDAREFLARAADRSEGVFRPWYLHALGVRATIEALAGNLRTATELAARVLEVATGSGIGRHPATAEAHMAVAIVRREQDELADAAFALDEAMALIRTNHRTPLRHLHAAETAWLALATGQHHEPAIDHVDTIAATLPAFSSRMLAADTRRLVLSGDLDAASLGLLERGDLRTADVTTAELTVAVARRDMIAAPRLLDELRGEAARRHMVERSMWQAVVADLAGNRDEAGHCMSAAVTAAEREGLRRVFLDAGPDVLRLLRSTHSRSPAPFLRSIIDRSPTRPAHVPRDVDLVEPLTDRELAVLCYLPTRLSNAEIARRLYVSVNTVKTHLKHIYRKLDAANRSSAIERAESLGLL